MPLLRLFSYRLAALLVLLAASPLARGQSQTCTALDGLIKTCRSGFTCAYSFGGGDLWERFTMHVTASENPEAETRISVFFDGEYHIVQLGMAEVGEVRVWTKLSDGEGDSFFRIANPSAGGGDVTVVFDCNRADTETTAPADAGDDRLAIADETPFAVGDTVVVDPGGPSEETNVVVGFGSLVLATPLQFAHAAGTRVVSRGPGHVPTAHEEGPVHAPLALSAFPNPAQGAATLALDVPEAGAVTVALFDLLGRRVALLHDGPLAVGSHTLRFEAAGLPNGVYVVRASGPSGTVSRRVTLLR